MTSKNKKHKQNHLTKQINQDKTSELFESLHSTSLYQQGEEVINAYEDVVNGEKFTSLTNKLINVSRHVISSCVFALLLFVIAGFTTNLALVFATDVMSTLSMLSTDLTMIFSTSFVTSILMGLIFKSNLYSICYKVISKILPFVSSKERIN